MKRDFAVYTALDIKAGKCVRMSAEKADEMTVYSDDPVAMALEWVEQGAERLHVVDLDGAFSGNPRQIATLERIASVVRVPISIGGGYRTREDIDRAMQ